MKRDVVRYRKRTRTDGIWELVWTDPETGRVRRESCKSRDEHVADRKLAEKILTGDVVPPEAITVGFLLDRYFQHIKRRKAANTVVPMNSKVLRLKAYFGAIGWEEFSQSDVENYIDHARRITRWDHGTEPLSNGTIRKDLEILRSALRHAHLHRTVPHETRIEIRGLPTSQRQDWLTRDQMRAVYARCADNAERQHIYGFLLLALATGARKEAIFNLTWSQVYIPEPRFEVLSRVPIRGRERTKDGTEYRILRGENDPLDYETGAVAEGAYIDFGEGRGNKRRPKISIGQNFELMEFLIKNYRHNSHVVTYRGRPITTGIKKGLESVGVEAGLPFKLTHHVLKRTCITWMVRKGIPFDTIELLTNTTVDTLKRYYSQHSPDLEEALGDTFSLIDVSRFRRPSN